jgi:outer membrane immunogenic protein
MNLSLLQFAAVLGAVLIAAPAVADEAPPVKQAKPVRHIERAPEQPAPKTAQTSWSGAQIGGQGGLSNMAQGFAEPGASQCFRDHALPGSPIAPSCPETPFGFDTRSLKSASGGGSIGYNFQFGGMILGLEADLSAKNGNSSGNQPVPPVVNGGFGAACPGCFSTRTESFSGNVNQGTDSSFRLRFGYLVTPMTMVYLTTGAAVEKVSGSFSYSAYTVNNIPIPGAAVGRYQDTTTGSGTWSETKTGWTVGGGVEVAVGGGWKARVEYRYTGFGNLTENVPLARSCTAITSGCPSPNSGSTNAQIDLGGLNFQTVKFGLAYSL